MEQSSQINHTTGSAYPVAFTKIYADNTDFILGHYCFEVAKDEC
jgi:hypothetical protein